MDVKGNKPLCYFIRDLRAQAGYNQQEVSEMLCISRSAYCYRELGKTSFDLEELVLLSERLGIRPDVFFEPELWSRRLSDLQEMKFDAPDLSGLGKLSEEEMEMISEYRGRAAYD